MISGDSDNTAKEEQNLRRFANQNISSHRVPELKSIPMSCRHFVLTTVFHVQQNCQQHNHHGHKFKRAIYNYEKLDKKQIAVFFNARIGARNFENSCFCRRVKISRGSVQMENFQEVLWSSTCDYTKACRANLSHYLRPDWQPV